MTDTPPTPPTDPETLMARMRAVARVEIALDERDSTRDALGEALLAVVRNLEKHGKTHTTRDLADEAAEAGTVFVRASANLLCESFAAADAGAVPKEHTFATFKTLIEDVTYVEHLALAPEMSRAARGRLNGAIDGAKGEFLRIFREVEKRAENEKQEATEGRP